MVRVKMEGIVEYLSVEMRKALAEAVARVFARPLRAPRNLYRW